MMESFTVTYNGGGRLVVTDVFDKQARADIVGKPIVTTLRAGESRTFFIGHAGITRKIKIYPFAP